MASDKSKNWWAKRRSADEPPVATPASKSSVYWAKRRGATEEPGPVPPVAQPPVKSSDYWTKRRGAADGADAMPPMPEAPKKADDWWAKRASEAPSPEAAVPIAPPPKKSSEWWAKRHDPSELPEELVPVAKAPSKSREWWAKRRASELAFDPAPDEVAVAQVSAFYAWGLRSASGGRPLLIAGMVALLLLAFAGYFATVQNVWIDESTQLLGSSVSLPRMFAWLTGGFEPFGVPGDRMPPLSYMLDWSCSHLGCSAPLPFRILHLIVTAIGVFVVTRLAGRRHGPIAGLVTGLMLVLLPQTILTAVEIRAYPIFVTLTCLQLVLLYRLVDRGLDWRSLLLFTAVGLATVYTHFFGLVASSAWFCGLIVARVRSKRELLIVAGAWACLLLLSAGLWPFFDGPQAVRASNDTLVTIGSVAFYLSHIIGSAPMLVVRPATLIFFACLGLLLATLALTIARAAFRKPLVAPFEPEVAIIAAIVAGVSTAIISAFFLKGFNPLEPSYSIWMLPAIALLAGAAAARGRIPAGLAVAMLLALVPIQGVLLRHADLFVHGPERDIDDVLGHDPRGAAIIYFGPYWAYPYFPLVYRHGDALAHYWVGEDGQLRPVGYAGDTNLLPIAPSGLAKYHRLLLVAVSAQTGSDLRAWLAQEAPPYLTMPIPLAGLPLDYKVWHPTAEIVKPGLYWLRLTRLERQ